MEPPRAVLTGAVVILAVLVGPWLARVEARLSVDAAGGGDAVAPTGRRTVLTTVLLALLWAGAVALTGVRPATVALAWAAAAGLVLGAVDLAAHRLPDRVTFPAGGVCAGALIVDAAVLGTWGVLLRALLAAAVAFGLAALAALVSPEGFGFGDVKLLGLLGLVLGWAGWEVLLAGVVLGLLVGGVVSLVLLATGRAGRRTAVPFGPPLLIGAAVALTLAPTLQGAVPLG